MTTPFKTLLSQVSPLASAIYAEGGSWAEAMRKAWATLKLKSAMLKCPQTFSYIKGNGEVRRAIGHIIVNPAKATTDRPTSQLVVKYFDLGWDCYRSFRADRLIIPTCHA